MSGGTARDRELAELLRTGPFHEALRATVTHSGLTLERLQQRLQRRGIRVSVTSLSYWQAGRSRPERAESIRAIRAIEAIVGVPAHSLTSLLGPPRPRGPRPALPDPGSYHGLLEPAESLNATLEDLLGPWDGKLRPQVIDETIVLNAAGTVSELRVRTLERAVEAAPDRHLGIFVSEEGNDATKMRIEARENCRVGRVRYHPTRPVIAAELLFDRALMPGDTHMLEYRLIDENVSAPSSEYRRAFRYPADLFVLSVAFDEARLPVRCLGTVETREDPTAKVSRELSLSAARIAHIAHQDVDPGAVTISWEWE